MVLHYALTRIIDLIILSISPIYFRFVMIILVYIEYAIYSNKEG